MVLNCAIFGAMFRPLEPTKKKKITRRQLANEEEVSAGTPLMVRIKRERDEKLRDDDQQEAMNQQQQTDHFHSSTNSLNNTVKLVGIKAKRSSTLTDSASSLGKKEKETPLLAAAGSKRSLANQDDAQIQPLNRDDAFYTGSLQRLPQYRENPASYHASVTRVLSLFIYLFKGIFLLYFCFCFVLFSRSRKLLKKRTARRNLMDVCELFHRWFNFLYSNRPRSICCVFQVSSLSLASLCRSCSWPQELSN